MTEERRCFILARWAGEKTDFSAGINLPWRWCSFTLPADVHSILSLGLKSLLIVVQLHQPGVQGRMQSSPERQEEPERAHLPQGLVLPWPWGILDPAEAPLWLQQLCLDEFPKALLPFLLRLEGEWFLLILLVGEIRESEFRNYSERRQREEMNRKTMKNKQQNCSRPSNVVNTLLLVVVNSFFFCRGKVFLSRPRLRKCDCGLFLPLTLWSWAVHPTVACI